jgi:hypothetical protein
MNCKEFWKHYEDSGLTPELENHLCSCEKCQKEMEAERALLAIARNLPTHQAPDYLWNRIAQQLPQEQPESGWVNIDIGSIIEKARQLIFPVGTVRLKPVIVSLAIMLTSILATHFYHTRPFGTSGITSNQKITARDLEKIEQEYLAAIDRLTEEVELNRDSIDPELYDLYNEKIAVLDEYIEQCRDALEDNEYNPNARRYLALAYIEKMETLKELSEHTL